jgi:uncharacterized protein
MNAAIRKNPVFWLMWAIPAAAVFAGVGMVAVAMQGADRALPDIYHWEGERLDADFERARVAVRLRLRAELELAAGECRLTLHGAEAAALELRLTSGSDMGLDRAHVLTRGADGVYRGACAPIARGKWRVALADAANTWSLRTQIEQATARIELQARAPEGPVT